mmetsp:Transcript_9543/g.20940  ORF Transcript_9543/g.20940 Transcript_9543/m.20940 type:complete len:744 (+) Transcript_9543:756-2987(+)
MRVFHLPILSRKEAAADRSASKSEGSIGSPAVPSDDSSDILPRRKRDSWARTPTMGFLGRSRGAVPCLRGGQEAMQACDSSTTPMQFSSPFARTNSASSSSRPPSWDWEDPEAVEVRLRFFNFNMGNSNAYSHVKDLQGPGGRGTFIDALRKPLCDGDEADIVFVTLVETRVNLTEWGQHYASQPPAGDDPGLDMLLLQNARREGKVNSKSRVRGWMEDLAASYNGNLKSMLCFNGEKFKEDAAPQVFGRLIEARVVGVPVPNPKKAFMGRSLRKVEDDLGVRLCFISAHFPVAKLAAALEDKAIDQLHGAKVALARSLRKVLRKAALCGVADRNCILFLQGDLNSRTVLRHEARENEYTVVLDRSSGRKLGMDVGYDDATTYMGGQALLVTTMRGGLAEIWNREHPYDQMRIGDVVVEVNGVRECAVDMMEAFKEAQIIEMKLHRKVTDVLMEVLRDNDMQQAISHDLDLPPGKWHEIAHYEIVHDLPVTYKFLDHVSCGSAHSPSSNSRGSSPAVTSPPVIAPPPFPLTVGDIMACQSLGRISSVVGRDVDTETELGTPSNKASVSEGKTALEAVQGNELYRRHLMNLGEQKLAEFGLVYKKNDFRAFRFPACADRVVFWAPDVVADRCSFELPQDGYEVNHSQLGSDHRPVVLEVKLRLSPPKDPIGPNLGQHEATPEWKQSRQADLLAFIGASEKESEGEGDDLDLEVSSGEETPNRPNHLLVGPGGTRAAALHAQLCT